MIDVLVVGAGPTGLFAAAELTRHGARVRIVDANPSPSTRSRAIAVHARTLEILDPLGLAVPLVRAGVKARGVQMRTPRETLVEARFEELDSRFPFLLCVPQTVTEAHLEAHLARLGVTVERGLSLVTLNPHVDSVAALLEGADGRTHEVHAAYVVGADGGHSTVRKSLGLDFPGSAMGVEFLLADARVDGDLAADTVTSFLADDGVVAFFPMPDGRFRLVLEAEDDDPDRGSREPPQLARIERLAARRTGQRLSLRDPGWLARFQVQTRQVERYRDGRVLLAGDAAHVHSPVGGQGMNTGLQDAHDLAWKLAWVVRGLAHATLLDTYHHERHRIGVELLRTTELSTRLGTVRAPLARALRNRLAKVLGSIEVVQQRIVHTTAELTLDYDDSPLSTHHQDPPRLPGLAEGTDLDAFRAFRQSVRAGARLPNAFVRARDLPDQPLASALDGERATLLLFTGLSPREDDVTRLREMASRLTAGFGRVVDVRLVVPSLAHALADSRDLVDEEGHLEEAFGARGECAYFVRPDLYLGLRCQPARESTIADYLHHWFVPEAAT